MTSVSGTASSTTASATVPTSPPGPTVLGVAAELSVVAMVVLLGVFLARRVRGRSAPGPEALAWSVVIVGSLVRVAQLEPGLRPWILVPLTGIALVFVASLGVDFFFGLAARLDPMLAEGTQVRVEDVEGRIQRLGLRFVEVESSDGWVFRIGYRRFLREIRIRSAPQRTAVAVRLDLLVPPEDSVAAARGRLHELVLSSPWCILSSQAEVDVAERPDGTPILRLVAYTFGREGRSRLLSDVLAGWPNARESAAKDANKPSA